MRRVVFADDGGGTPVSPETCAAVNAAAVALSDAGLHVDSVIPEGLQRARELWQVLFCDVAALALAPIIKDRDADLSPSLRKFLAYAASRPPLTAEKLLQTLVARDELRARFLAQMETYQVLLAPVSCGPAFRHGEAGWGCGTVDYLDDMRFTQWFNLLGNPAAVMPVGQSPEGLPIGVQVVGRPYEEETVLAVTAVIEQRFGARRPPIQWAAAGA